MYANPKNSGRKIVFLILANVILIIAVLFLLSWVLNWNFIRFVSWIPVINQPEEQGVVEREVDPLVIEKSDMDKREEYLNAKEQQLNLLEKELETKQAELKAYESELNTQKESIEKEKAQFQKQQRAFDNEEERYRATATMINNMDLSGSVELLSNEEIQIYEVVKILLTLNKMAEEQGRFSSTPLILQEMATPVETAGDLTPEQIQSRRERAAKILDWIARYDINISENNLE
jgi:hypothetical protein